MFGYGVAVTHTISILGSYYEYYIFLMANAEGGP